MTTLYYNGNIHSMDEMLNTYTAMVVCGGKIVDLGVDHELMSHYPDADLYDLKGKTVIPGLIDSHAHIFMAADSEGDGELYIPTSVEELLNDLRDRVKNIPEGEWISYKNTYPLRLEELRYPTLQELDTIAPKHPVAVDGFYSAQLNSCALKSLDLSHLPAGGRVIYDNDGAMTGTLLNCFAMLVRYYKTRTVKPQKEAICEVMHAYNQMGITSSVEAMSTMAGIDAVEKLYDEGRQTVRLRYTMMVPPLDKHNEFIQNIRSFEPQNAEFSRINFIKNTIDGGILTGTSLMEYAYQNLESVFSLYGVGDDWRGNLVTDVDVLTQSILLAQEMGLQYGAHCVGSRAAQKLIDAYKKANVQSDIEGRRHALLHADFMDKSMISDVKELDLTVLFQPAWHYMDAPYMDKIVDARECARFMPYMQILSSGVHAAAGSDHMVKYDADLSVNPYNPFTGLYNMVTCRARDGEVYGEHQAIDRISALLYYTRHAAWSIFDEKLIGSLARSHRADFLILNKNYFECSEEDIRNIHPIETIVEGKCVYKA